MEKIYPLVFFVSDYNFSEEMKCKFKTDKVVAERKKVKMSNNYITI